MICYTIEAALASTLDSIVITSDSEPILAVAEAHITKHGGAERVVLHKRPQHLASDESGMLPTVWDVVDNAAGPMHAGDAVMVLQPTSPVREAHHIDECLDLVRESGCESVVAVSDPLQHPGDMVIRIQDRVEFYLPRTGDSRRQDYESMFFVTGSHYLATLRFLRQTAGFIGPSTHLFEIDPEYSLDVDTIHSFRIAEAVLYHRRA